MDFLADIPPLQIGASGLVVLVVILVLTGKLVPASTVKDALTQRDKAMDLADAYQKVATEHGMTLHQILDAVETIDGTVTAIQTGLTRPVDKGPRR